MSINATNNAKPRTLIPAGNHLARCYSMVELGTILEDIKGDEKYLQKVRIGWELPEEMRVFDEAKGPQPLAIHKDYTMSLGEKANLRKMLDSWRGIALTDAEAKSFDLTKLLGKACMVNIIHKTSKKGNQYEEISSVTPVPKGLKVKDQINPTVELSYDNFDDKLFQMQPEFIREKMKGSLEYKELFEAKPMNHARDVVNNKPNFSLPPNTKTEPVNMNEIDPASIIEELPF